MKELQAINVQLVHIQGPLKGQIQEFNDSVITVGRHPSCHVQFPTELTTISRNHAELIREGNRYKIIDRSTNGTFLNGKKVSEAFLKDGDIIMFTEGGPKISYLAKITDAVLAEPAREPLLAEPVAGSEPYAHQAKAAFISEPAKSVSSEPDLPEHPPATPSSAPVKPATEPTKPAAKQQSVLKVQAPLIVQFGPMLKSYKELPIIIGKKPDADFVLNYPAIQDAHAQIFFSQNQYWIKDLTGTDMISINSKPIGYEACLKAQDIISLSPGGPALRFLGEGRLAEYEAEPAPDDLDEVKETRPAVQEPVRRKSKSIFDIFKK